MKKLKNTKYKISQEQILSICNDISEGIKPICGEEHLVECIKFWQYAYMEKQNHIHEIMNEMTIFTLEWQIKHANRAAK